MDCCRFSSQVHSNLHDLRVPIGDCASLSSQQKKKTFGSRWCELRNRSVSVAWDKRLMDSSNTPEALKNVVSVNCLYERGGSIESNCERNNVRVITEKKCWEKPKFWPTPHVKTHIKHWYVDLHMFCCFLNTWLFTRYDISMMLFTIVFPFVQGATVFYWCIWQNLRVACKALSQQLLSICSDALRPNSKTIYRPFENVMFSELYCCDTNGCPAVWSKCNLGKSIHWLEGCCSFSFTQGCFFFKMTPAGHPSLFNCIFFIIFLLFLLCNNYPFIPNGMLFLRNLKHLSLCGQSSWPGSGCDQCSSAKKQQWRVCLWYVVVLLVSAFYSVER